MPVLCADNRKYEPSVHCVQAYVGEVSTASVACGVLGVGGNKGGVAVSFTLYRRRLCCVSSHFAAHQVSSCSSLFSVKLGVPQHSAALWIANHHFQ